jgi:hypothetical protein
MDPLPNYAIEYIVLTQHSGELAAGIDLRFRVYVYATYGIRIVHRLNHFTRFYGYSTRLISVMQFLHIIKSGQANTVNSSYVNTITRYYPYCSISNCDYTLKETVFDS